MTIKSSFTYLQINTELLVINLLKMYEPTSVKKKVEFYGFTYQEIKSKI